MFDDDDDEDEKMMDLRYTVDKQPYKWTWKIESSVCMDDIEGIVASVVSLLKYAEDQGINKDDLVDSVLENLDRSEVIDGFDIKRILPRGDA